MRLASVATPLDIATRDLDTAIACPGKIVCQRLMTTLCGTRSGARPSGTKENLSLPAEVVARG